MSLENHTPAETETVPRAELNQALELVQEALTSMKVAASNNEDNQERSLAIIRSLETSVERYSSLLKKEQAAHLLSQEKVTELTRMLNATQDFAVSTLRAPKKRSFWTLFWGTN